MKAVYWLLPFMKQLFVNQVTIHKIQKNTTKKNESMFDNFNTLHPEVQRFMLQF
jgi:hypothetical protein